MLFDFENGTDLPAFSADICIVGGGAAGIVLALELERRGFKILLLEAGGLKYEPRSQAMYSGEIGDLPFEGLINGRFRGLGGTTNDWGGQIAEIDDYVFSRRDWLNGGEWPFTKEHLKAYYERAGAYEGLNRQVEIEEPLSSLRKLIRNSELKVDVTSFCPKLNFYRLFEHDLVVSENILVVYHANVCEFVLDATDQNVSRVKCRSTTGRSAFFQASSFVLTVGGIETSRLLLQPRKETPFPWQRHGQLGVHFQDHVVVKSAVFHGSFRDAGYLFGYFAKDGVKFHPKLRMKPARQSALRVLDAAGTISPILDGGDRLAKAFNTVRLARKRKFDQISLRDAYVLLKALPELLWHRSPFASRGFGASKASAFQLWVHTEQRPDSASRITLTEKTDELGLYVPKVDWKVDELELRTVQCFTDDVSAAFAANGFPELTTNPVVANRETIGDQVLDSMHHMGGARMASSQRDGVVDENLRVMGTDNFFVCSSAVFPSAGFSNPTHTVLALAIRLSDHLYQKAAQNAVRP